MEKKYYLYAITAIIVSIIVTSGYFFSNRFIARTTEKLFFVYDSFKNSVEVYGINGKKISDKNLSEDKNYVESVKKMKIFSEYNPSECSKEYPILVKIENGSNEKLLFATFKLDVRKNGHSQSLIATSKNGETLAMLEARYSFDRIIPQNSAAYACYIMPKLSEKIDPDALVIAPYNIEYTFDESFGGDIFLQQRFKN